MKKISILTLALMISIFALAQPGKKPVAAAPVKNNPHLKVFSMALNSGDINAASVALNYYITEQGTINTPYADTLAMLYMQLGAYPQCFFWANNRLAQKPDDKTLMEMKGVCLDKMQQPKEAIDVFEKLFRITQSPYHGYKLMELQYSIKRLAECIVTANAVERLEFKPEMVMSYSVGDQIGRTYLQAGIFNIHGLALYDLDKKPEAKAYFEKAVALDANFALAKQNLEAMKATAGGTPPTNPDGTPKKTN